jgi:hypothetical protein
MTDVERLREELYAWCGRRVACKKAAEYYIMSIQNPCYPPADKMTYKMRKFYMEIVEKYGPPPKCDVRALVFERLRGTMFEPYVQEIAELAELLRRELNITSRVAAATAAAVVAGIRRIRVSFTAAAGIFGTSPTAVAMHYRRALDLYYSMRRRAA